MDFGTSKKRSFTETVQEGTINDLEPAAKRLKTEKDPMTSESPPSQVPFPLLTKALPENVSDNLEPFFLASLKARETSPLEVFLSLPQEFIVCRKTVVGWLMEICEFFHLSTLTGQAAVRLMDRFFARSQRLIQRSRYQLVAVASLLITAKIEEADHKVPSIEKLCWITDNSYNDIQVKMMEELMLTVLEWRIMEITPLHFITFFQDVGLSSTDTVQSGKITAPHREAFKDYTLFYAGSICHEKQFQRYLPSVVAAAAVATARQVLNFDGVWNEQLETVTGYTLQELIPCMEAMSAFSA